jgi:hypothetical protein
MAAWLQSVRTASAWLGMVLLGSAATISPVAGEEGVGASGYYECPRFRGYGEIDVPPALWETLFLIGNQNGATPPEIWRFIYPKSNAGASAINKRLNDLFEFGRVRRETEGRAWKYFTAKPKNSLARCQVTSGASKSNLLSTENAGLRGKWSGLA